MIDLTHYLGAASSPADPACETALTSRPGSTSYVTIIVEDSFRQKGTDTFDGVIRRAQEPQRDKGARCRPAEGRNPRDFRPGGRPRLYDNFQYSYLSSEPYRSGTFDEINPGDDGDECTVTVSLAKHNSPHKDSGAPFILCCFANGRTDTVFAFGSSNEQYSPYPLIVTPLYDGMHVLCQKHNALGSSAFLCNDADC